MGGLYYVNNGIGKKSKSIPLIPIILKTHIY